MSIFRFPIEPLIGLLVSDIGVNCVLFILFCLFCLLLKVSEQALYAFSVLCGINWKLLAKPVAIGGTVIFDDNIYQPFKLLP